MADKRPVAVFDIECYHGFFCINFIEVHTGKRKSFEMFEGRDLDRRGIASIVNSHTLVSFNGNHYDIPQLRVAMKPSSTCQELKAQNDAIFKKVKTWHLRDQFGHAKLTTLDHIDIIEPAPSNVSLKLYGGRLHSKKLQDLPIDPDSEIEPEQRLSLVQYCYNDCETTIDLYRHIKPQLDFREQLGKQYECDLRSKSDTQIAGVIILGELKKITGKHYKAPELPADYKFKYVAPNFIKFQTSQFEQVFETVKNATFGLKVKAAKVDPENEDEDSPIKTGGIEMPDEIKKLRIVLGESKYKLGIGGLHSMEKSSANFSDERNLLQDADVARYYPSIILICKLFPKQIGEPFLQVYETLAILRDAAKANIKAGINVMLNNILCTVIDKTVKIVLNGTFGLLGYKYSFLFSPDLMIQVTMTGQLSILMLIEKLELEGIPVVSANTDGIVTRTPRELLSVRERIVAEWEKQTGFTMETTEYSALYCRDVNNYIALKPDGEVKQKGVFAFVGSKGSPAEKNPSSQICIDAVIAYLKHGTPLEDTIEWNMDIRRFVSVRTVKGGALYGGEYLGAKAVRWYYGTSSTGHIEYASNGNLVPKSTGAVPLMELPDMFPSDMNYQYYIDEARKMLDLIGSDYRYDF